MNKLRKKIILTVCHDAGGAEIISSFVRKNRNKYRFYCVVCGSAIRIFQRKNLSDLMMEFGDEINPARIFERIEKIDLLLVGTSWSTNLELNFIGAAKMRNIKSAAYFDHWVNYREKFGYPAREWMTNLPDEIWVSDKYALAMAKRKFSIPVRLMSNEFFNDIKNDWQKYKKVKPRKRTILFASEPIDAMKNRGRSTAERTILKKIINLLAKYFPGVRLIIRLHPSEPAEKYRELIEKYGQDLKIDIHSSKKNMLADLARVGAVIGMKSMFLIVAVLCGKKTASFLPHKNLICPLPYSQIIKIRDLEQLKTWLNNSIK